MCVCLNESFMQTVSEDDDCIDDDYYDDSYHARMDEYLKICSSRSNKHHDYFRILIYIMPCLHRLSLSLSLSHSQ